jgi:hypothetical protein
MNRQQKIVLGGAFLNALVLMTFPPCDVESLMRGTPTFDAFYPIFAIPPGRAINADILYCALAAVMANAAAAWALLASAKHGRPRVDPGNLVVALGFLNLALVFGFPPFEAQPLAGRFGGGTFDGFQFVFGGGARRTIFVPLLYLEVVFVLVNACAFWLALRERTAAEAVDDSIDRLFAEKQEFEARVQQGVEDRIKEEARKAGRAAARVAKPDGS